ncbi:SurA N-terminal domain-containing protein [Peterkaempfera sp. SMS 1(5)a]|uniref:SurA N-terminal domain-containing protein n=1 Tax=Peterkaempfera podocarpi TaxID=3232308 RepID=UPI003672D349
MIRNSVPDRTAAPVRRRAAAVAGAVLAAAALTACGSTAHPGAAAVVGDHRITTSAVEARVTAFRDAVADESQGQAQAENGGLVRNTVRDMILSDLVSHALAEHQLSVSAEEVQQAHASDAGQLGGETALTRALLEQKGVAPSATDDFYRRVLGMQKLAALTGADPNTEQGSEALRKTLADAAKDLKVEINPRYGTWDPQKVTFSDDADNWLRTGSTKAS